MIEFYRYETVDRTPTSYDINGEVIPNRNHWDIRLELQTFNLVKETKKGYWICSGNPNQVNKLKEEAYWVSKTAKKRFAYPSKEQALKSFICKKELQIKILNMRLSEAISGKRMAKHELEKLKS